ncbi:MAG: helix-turn-helix domain-containing protein [Polaromonas sp.]|uniref:helix-turn-helix domain-containing protein n=1 Tax=Polaromonas sp. TaxID=1869339 RepID=UPI0024890879|nr:helix-turn-helix domain-containing protein [Polaromonas sp.]MDI1270599.1 helix-turn-helix domain-containing protein [Polaromonas sp.]
MMISIQAPKLQGALKQMIEILNANQSDCVSTLDFLDKGILSPAAGIAILKKKGVIFETTYRTLTDRSGRVRKNIACYKIVGVAVL